MIYCKAHSQQMMCRSTTSYVAVPFRDQCFRRAIKLNTDDRGWAKALFAPSVQSTNNRVDKSVPYQYQLLACFCCLCC